MPRSTFSATRHHHRCHHQLYVRDTYDHVTRLLDSVEAQRDLLNNTLGYLHSANTNGYDPARSMKDLQLLFDSAKLPAFLLFHHSSIRHLSLQGGNAAKESSDDRLPRNPG
jgi:hypothetical protein